MHKKLKYITGGFFSTDGVWKHICRTMDTSEIIVMTEGNAYMFVEDKEYALSRGDVLFIPRGAYHGGVKDSVGVSFFWIHYTDEDGIKDGYVLKPVNTDRAITLARELLHFAGSDGYPKECLDAMCYVLLCEIERREPDRDKLTEEIDEWIRKNRKNKIGVKDVAMHFGYCEDYVSRAYKKGTGNRLKDTIDRIRLEGIKADLQITSQTLAEIGYAYGFSEYKYFLKFFKYHEGVSPTEYRDMYTKMHTN